MAVRGAIGGCREAGVPYIFCLCAGAHASCLVVMLDSAGHWARLPVLSTARSTHAAGWLDGASRAKTKIEMQLWCHVSRRRSYYCGRGNVGRWRGA